MKTRLFSVYIALALLAGVHPARAQPHLVISPTGNQIFLLWPATATNYVLQSATNSISPHWQTVPFQGRKFGTFNNIMYLPLTNSPSAIFFRLCNTNSAPGMELVPAGVFTMGDVLDGEEDAIPTNVMVSGFYLDANPITYGQWQSVYSWATNAGYGFDHASAGKAANHPVQSVNWYDCVKWCNARSQQTGFTPVYYTDAGLTHIYTNGDVDAVYANWAAHGFRLPTEAEWEKAARGGLSGQRFPWGDTIDRQHANYDSIWSGSTPIYPYDLAPTSGYDPAFNDGIIPYTNPSGYFLPNGYEIGDMAGNVFNWCWDWYAPAYGQPTTNNPTGPLFSPPPYNARVLRGNAWDDLAANGRCSDRNYALPNYGSEGVGFRCVKGF